ncbi:MAG: amino acid adenylation domain-containing protein [Bacteroidaceae bacterium]|nr:amino acid adenylation domain-containing protein [Bacteroidaceae bacterium]
MNYIELFNNAAKKFSSRTALVDSNGLRQTSYNTLDQLSSKVAGKLIAGNCAKGDSIMIYMGRQMEYWAAYLGILKAGCIIVPVVPDYPQDRISYIRSDCGSKLTITTEFFDDIDSYKPYCNPADGCEPALLAYTSGSTGNPKGILFSTADLARGAIRHKSIYSGIDPIINAGAGLFPFLIHIFEYLTVFILGGTTHIIDDETRKSAVGLARYYKDNGITTGFVSPQLLRVFRNTASSLRRIFTGSERVSGISPAEYCILNGYGMSEVCAFVTTFMLDREYSNTPIGKQLEDLKVEVCNEQGERVPDGQDGEICITGCFDAIYFKDPERTSTVMTPAANGQKQIHTGDIGKVDENGDIVYLNRKDWMVKVNGQRVETLEIETQLSHIEGIGNAAVKAFQDADGQNYLVAYYVSKENTDENDLRQALKQKLPEYMIPRFFVRMDSLPKNINGKLDRKALLAPAAEQYKTTYVAPADSTEQIICNAFEQVLCCGTVGTADNFFALGGDSIKVLKLMEAIGIDSLKPDMIFTAKTPKAIAALCLENNEKPIVHNIDIPQYTPLSDSQLGVYLDSMQEPLSLKYNIPVLCRLPEDTDRNRFIQAVKKVAANHKAFCVNIDSANGTPQMHYAEQEIQVSEIETDNISDTCKSLIKPFDLEQAPLYRFALIHTTHKELLFFLDVHHIIFDGTSLSAFVSQIAQSYNGNNAEPEQLNIFDVALAEQYLTDSNAYRSAQDFFRKHFDGTECDSNPVSDKLSDDSSTGAGTININAATVSKSDVLHFTKEHKITENSLFLGAFAYTLARFNAASDCMFCTVNNGRHDTGLANSIGMFVKTLPLYFRFAENRPVADYLSDVQQYFFETMSHDCIRFSELASEYGIGLNISFVYQAEMFSGAEIGNGVMSVEMLETGNTQSDIHFMLFKTADGYSLTVSFRNALYSESLIRNFAGMYLQVINDMLQADTLNDIRFTDADAEKKIFTFNQTEKPYDSNTTVVELFRKQASATPDAPCLVYKDKKFTYREIDRITDSLARHLRNNGMDTGCIAGVLIPRCEYMLICSLGILKAGGAYLPLDASYPQDRLNLMMQDSGAIMLITTPELNGIITSEFKGLRMMTDEIPDLPDNDRTPLPDISPDNLFIVLYTSGSTGTPKGVMFAHSNTLVTATWQKDFYALGPGCNVTAYASYGFDANVFDTYATIISGATLHIISDDIRLDLLELQKYFNRNNITHATMTTQVGRQFALLKGTESLRFLNVAGEKLTPLEPPTDFCLYNLYGPTEGSILVSGYHVDMLYKDIPIGKALDNVKMYIADSVGRLLPAGAAGELWISGPHVTKGYLNNPEKTAQAYGLNTFCNEPGYERIYKTGDIVRFLDDGNLQFIGRRDAQVKVRGFRVELTEVEEVIRRFEGIKDATVAAFDAPSGGKFIAAYVVSDNPVDIEAMNAFIKAEKPPYMVPEVTMQIDAIPLNQNQKVNRKALPQPERKAADTVAPENDCQKRIFDIAAEILGHTAFGIDTNLFEAGLSSIGMLKMNVALGSEFSVPVKIDDLKQHDTIRKLEEFFGKTEKSINRDIMSDYPLTQTQKGIFVECSSRPDSVIYNIPLLIKLSGKTDTEKLADAVKAAINAHPYVKTTLFADNNGDLRARRNDIIPVNISVETIDSIPSAQELVVPFQLLGAPLYRICIYKTKSGNYLFMDFHHIIYDGTSSAIMLTDIDRAYSGNTLAKEALNGFEMALEEEEARTSQQYERAKAAYDAVFAGCETECLPPKSPEKATNGVPASGAASAVRKSITDYDRLKSFCNSNKLSLNAFFNTAFALTLSRYCLSDEIVYTTVYHGRSDSRLASTVSMLVKTLPVLVQCSEKGKITDLIRHTGEQLIDSMSNDLYSFAEISRSYGIKSDIIFVYQGDNFSFETLCGEKAEFIEVLPPVAKAPLTLTVNLENGTFSFTAEYMKEMYSADFIESFLGSLDCMLGQLICNERLEQISLLDNTSAGILERINNTECKFENIPAHRFFERHAAENPNQTAVICNGRSLSYDQVNRQANRLAHKLIEYGVGPDCIVSIILNRSVELDIAEIGILKSGGAFLGLLPDYPDDRIGFCLEDAESKIVITTRAIQESKAELLGKDKPYRTIFIEDIVSNGNDTNPETVISQNSLAYCIYTSGSTGNPKGVLIEHHNLACLAQPFDGTYSNFYGKNGGKVCLAISSISFDMSIFDNLLFLLNGKTVCIATEQEIHNPALLIDVMTENAVECVSMTPSMAVNYLSIPEFQNAMKKVKAFVAGAEAFPESLYTKLKSLSPDMHIINGYGPSECTMTCCAKELEDGQNITLGRPLPNTAFYVLDKNGNILPRYACGELIICGELVGRGYMKLPEKTKASFFTLQGKPAYHSGDVVRINGDGEIDFFGRRDNQVKLRGFRVELDEIERTILAFGHISQCKVIVSNNGSEDYLVGYFAAEKQIDTAELAAFLKSKLTYYMVPDILVQIEKIPLTPNGKVDKKALPQVSREKKKSGRRAPKKSLEQQICELFAATLSLDEYFADDNFFENGGTSLSASKIIMQLMSAGIRVEYQDIFDNPTPESLAEYIESHKPDVPKTAGNNAGQSQKDDTDRLLQYNSLGYAAQVKRQPLGNVLLTGAVGFLGIHILNELLEMKEGKIICLVRSKDGSNPESRLHNMLMYYYGRSFEKEIIEQIETVDADITDDNLISKLENSTFDTIINCAAVVKHYSSDDTIERVNVHGVENLIGIAKSRNARLIQISTVSIPGVHTEDTYRRHVTMHENELFVIDSMDNKYGISKYHAELKMLEAIDQGMKGKIIRVGNLMGRHSDGEFQINFNTNAFLNALRGFTTLGKCPISHATDPMSFSPVDLTAKAIVLLAGTNDMFTAFHADNRYGFDEMQLIEACNRLGLTIKPVPDEEYYADYYRMLGDERMNGRLQGLLTNDRPDLHMVNTDNMFTANVLYRLGFSWPFMDGAYLERTLSSLLTLDYFDMD